MKIIVSGPLQAGKSTVIKAVLDLCPKMRVGGFATLPLVEAGGKRGFVLQGNDGRKEIFAQANFHERNDDTSYRFRPEAFDGLGCSLLDQARDDDLTVIDELGIMERSALRFVALVPRLFHSGRHVLAVIQQRALDFWLEKIGGQFIDRIYLVSAANRETLPQQIVNDLNGK